MIWAHRDKSAPGMRRVKLPCFALVLVPITVFVMESLISTHLAASGPDIPVSILSDDHPWLEASGRHRFLAATWFFACFAVLAAALLVRKLARPTAPATRVAAIATWFLVMLLAFSPTLQNHIGSGVPPIYAPIGTELFEAVLSRGILPGCSEPDDLWLLGRCGEMPVAAMFDGMIDLINALAGLGVGALIVGMILCLDTRDCASLDEEADLAAENLRQMRQQLYLSSLILTFGMFFATSWLYWPLPLVAEPHRAAYGALLLSMALYTGTYFSLLILSFYLPVAIILDGRARDLAQRAARGMKTGNAGDAETWLDARGLKDGAGDYLRAGFALTAPILTAFAGGITPLAF